MSEKIQDSLDLFLPTAMIIQHQMIRRLWMMNWKRCGKKQTRPILRYYFSICPGGMRETKNTQYSQVSGLTI